MSVDGGEGELLRIARALERLAGGRGEILIDGDEGSLGYTWRAGGGLLAVEPKAPKLGVLAGVEGHKKALLENGLRLAKGKGAHNALLWGARGMGKSSLAKATTLEASRREGGRLALVGVRGEDVGRLSELFRFLGGWKERGFVVLCDDLSFERGDGGHKALKAAMEGGLEGLPENVVVYATSNRRRLLDRRMVEEEEPRSRRDAEDEEVSLSERFALWLGFYPCDRRLYEEMVEKHMEDLGVKGGLTEALKKEASAWAMARGGRSGRIARQFAVELSGCGN